MPIVYKYNTEFMLSVVGIMSKYPNVSIVHYQDINSYSIMDIADFGVAINSQAGLEMLYRKKLGI